MIGTKATTPEGKMYTAQLGSVVAFYNKAPEATELPEINWEKWSNKLQTSGLVDKVKTNTENLLKEKYNVESVAEKVSGEPSEEYKKIVG